MKPERFTITLRGPMGCGKTVLARRLIQMLQEGPENHHPVTIHDGETIFEIDGRQVREVAARDYARARHRQTMRRT